MPEHISAVEELKCENLSMILEEVAEVINISICFAHNITHEKLHYQEYVLN
jgi:hypothetical protein